MLKFNEVNQINVNGYTEKKGNLTYLSWANAWGEFCKIYPTATYEIKKNDTGLPLFGNSELGYMCYTSVTVEELTHEMWLPVMDHRNKALLKPTTFDINKTVMRCLTKNLAMFGLGLYIYAGEDIPEDSEQKEAPAKTELATEGQIRAIYGKLKATGITEAQFKEFMSKKDTKHDYSDFKKFSKKFASGLMTYIDIKLKEEFYKQ
jgi:hypothetical protein